MEHEDEVLERSLVEGDRMILGKASESFSLCFNLLRHPRSGDHTHFWLHAPIFPNLELSGVRVKKKAQEGVDQ